MVKLDLHCHVAEQKSRIIEFFLECEKQGVNEVAITDHKTLKAFTEKIPQLTPEELRKIPSSIKIVIGIEMTGMYKFTNKAGQTRNIAMDILGFNLDLSKEGELDSWVKVNYVNTDSPEYQRKELEMLITIARQLGFKADYDDMQIDSNDPNKRFAGRVIGEGLANKKYQEHNLQMGLSPDVIDNPRCFFGQYCKNPDSPFFRDFSETVPKIEDVMDIIKKCGGMVFVPHIAGYNSKTGEASEVANAWEDSRKLAHDFVQQHRSRIDGLEVIHPMNDSPNDEFIEFLYGLASENGLYVSGGTDYHQPGEVIGKDPKGRAITPERLPGIEKWIKMYTIQEICEMVRENKAREESESCL